jgi:hypothetical protein
VKSCSSLLPFEYLYVRKGHQSCDTSSGAKVIYDGVLMHDTYMSPMDEHGKKILPKDVPVAPVNP